jgi:hypothetical protein
MLAIILTLLVLAAAAVVFIAKRQTSLSEAQAPGNLNRENLRPLFAPDEKELCAAERVRQDGERARAEEEGRLAAERRLANFNEFRHTWRESPARKNTIELLLRASQSESGKVFSDTVDEILHTRPVGLSAAEIATLIESHFWLLPQNERTPGVTFTINRDVAALRSGSHTKSEEEASDAQN